MGNMYLESNGTRFNIKYDAEVTNLKYNYAESVQTTLGSPYPYVRRNGDQRYRTFTLSGLISAVTFDEDDGIGYSQLSDNSVIYAIENIDTIEKQYRDEVIAFLHDGATKEFYSDHTGTINVRLTNITLTPKKELGGTLYTFSAQATEVA